MFHWSPTSDVHDRYLGCMIGGAIGDALGAPVQFMGREEIHQNFGSLGITRFESAFGGVGRFTACTQMALFTAEGLLRGWVRNPDKSGGFYLAEVACAYLRWLATQGERPRLGGAEHCREGGWLISDRRLLQRRSPDKTSLSALSDMGSLGKPASNDSKGCGGVVRAASVGLFARNLPGWTLSDGFRLAVDIAALTHGHPTGFLAAGVLAALIWRLADGRTLPDALMEAKSLLVGWTGFEETFESIERAERLATSSVPRSEAVTSLGEGLVADEALAIGIYSALVAPDYAKGALLAVNHSGRSDSTGVIAGALLGTRDGVNGIPALWLSAIEAPDVLGPVADDLYWFPSRHSKCGVGRGDEGGRICDRYFCK